MKNKLELSRIHFFYFLLFFLFLFILLFSVRTNDYSVLLSFATLCNSLYDCDCYCTIFLVNKRSTFHEHSAVLYAYVNVCPCMCPCMLTRLCVHTCVRCMNEMKWRSNEGAYCFSRWTSNFHAAMRRVKFFRASRTQLY